MRKKQKFEELDIYSCGSKMWLDIYTSWRELDCGQGSALPDFLEAKMLIRSHHNIDMFLGGREEGYAFSH